MKKSLIKQAEKTLKNKNGFTLTEIIITVAIILILAVLSTNYYMKFTEDAYLTKDIAYVKTLLVEIEALILSGEFNLPDNTTTEVGKTTKTSVSNTGVIYVWSNGTCTSAYRQSTSSSTAGTAKGTENLAKVLANCGTYTFESNTAKSVGATINSSTGNPTMVAEIRYQVYKGIPYVYVWNYYSTSKEHWYPSSFSCGAEVANVW